MIRSQYRLSFNSITGVNGCDETSNESEQKEPCRKILSFASFEAPYKIQQEGEASLQKGVYGSGYGTR